jgi:hypothetical protein
LPGLAGAAALALLAAQPALALNYPAGGPNGSDRVSEAAGGERAQTGRTRDDRNQNNRRQRAPAAPTPEELRTAAQAQMAAAGLDCQVTEAISPGVTAEQARFYEAACASGPGYILIASTPPQVFNCLELAGQAETSRLHDPTAEPGQQCVLPANQNGLAVIGGYARDAGLACTADQAIAVGKSDAGGLVYEVGCAEGSGFWVEKVQDGWKTTPCWDLALSRSACRYTTATEVLASWKTVLAGSPAASCDVQEARRVGRDAQGLTVYEVKCAVGDGYLLRVGADWKAQQFHPCATSRHIGGGCTLTPSPAAAAPAEQ